jgi:hypothetical protein
MKIRKVLKHAKPWVTIQKTKSGKSAFFGIQFSIQWPPWETKIPDSVEQNKKPNKPTND